MPTKLPVPVTDFCGVDLHCYAYGAYHWQTLIGGLIAIGAAWYAGRAVRRQIAASELAEAARLARRERAARAVLPLTLTQFIDFAEASAAVVRQIGDENLTPGQPPLPLAPLEIPQIAITDIERMIEASNDEQVAAILTRLAGHTQVLHSIIADMVARVNQRGNGLFRRDPNRPAFELRIARVHAAAAGLFRWARGEADGADEIDWDAIDNSLKILRLGDPRTHELVARERSKEAKPLDW